MSCALYAFVSSELHTASKHNDTRMRRGIEPMTLLAAHAV